MSNGRGFALNYLSNKGHSDLDVYLFGIFSGTSTKMLSNGFDRCNVKYRKLLGFDSFCGLPDESPNIPIYEKHAKGNYSASKHFNSNNIQQMKQIILDAVNNQKLLLVDGFYCDSLNKKLILDFDLKPALFVDIDVDLYSSTFDVFDFMIPNKLLIPGSVIYFDDWGGCEEGTGGESRAWMELANKYNIQYTELFSWRGGIHAQKVFKIDSLNYEERRA